MTVRRRIRIAYVVHTFDVGGIERCVAHLCNELNRQQFAPQVICLNRSGAARHWIDSKDVEIIEIGKRPGNDMGAVFRLAGALRRGRIDLVHSHNWGTLVETTLARRMAGVPVHVHAERGTVLGTVEFGGVRHRIRAKAMRWALGRCDAVVSNSSSVANRVERRSGFPAERIHVVPNGIVCPLSKSDRMGRQRIRRSLGIAHDALVVGSVGRLVPVKNFGAAFEALALLKARGHDVHLVLIGDGPERERLARASAEFEITDQVHFVGHQQRVGEWLAALDVYLNTSHSEGMSQAILEAMSCGLPLVVSDVGDNALLVGADPPCGVVVEPNNVIAVADAVASLARDPQQRAELGRNALVRYRASFTLERMIRDYECLYARLLQRSMSKTACRAYNPGGNAALRTAPRFD